MTKPRIQSTTYPIGYIRNQAPAERAKAFNRWQRYLQRQHDLIFKTDISRRYFI